MTHTAVTPLDLVKCRLQVDPKMYKGNFDAWAKIGRAEGVRGIFTGWCPTFCGCSVSHALLRESNCSRCSKRLRHRCEHHDDLRPRARSNTVFMNPSRSSMRLSEARKMP